MAEAEVRSLSGVELVTGLTAEVREAFEKCCRWHRCCSGEQVMDRDDENRDVFFVVAAPVRVVNYPRSGCETAYASINPSGYFGELAAIDGQPRSATVATADDCPLAAVPPQVFLTLPRS